MSLSNPPEEILNEDEYEALSNADKELYAPIGDQYFYMDPQQANRFAQPLSDEQYGEL